MPHFHLSPCLLTSPPAGMRENQPPNSPDLLLCLCQSLAQAGSWNCESPCLQRIVIADIGSAVTCNFILSCFASVRVPLGVRHLALPSSTFGRKSAPPSSCGESYLLPFIVSFLPCAGGVIAIDKAGLGATSYRSAASPSISTEMQQRTSPLASHGTSFFLLNLPVLSTMLYLKV